VPRTKRAAVYRAGAVGDSLIASSVVALLARSFDEVEVICDAPWSCMWAANPHVTTLTELPDGTLPIDSAVRREWAIGKAREYAKFVDLTNSVEVQLTLAPTQAAFHWPAAVRRSLCDRSYLELAHDIAELPHDFSPGPRFYPSDAERQKAERLRATLGSPLFGLQMAGSRIDRVYPFWVELVVRLLRGLPAAHVMLFGAPGPEAVMAESVVQAVAADGTGDRVAVAISRDSKEWRIRESLTMLQQCDLVVGPDTGPMWAVAMEPMPKLCLLSVATPTNVTKHWKNTVALHASSQIDCWPCHRLHETNEFCRKSVHTDAAACISDIHPDIVLAHVSRFLRDGIGRC